MSKNISKAGILLALLGVPAFIFLFLKFFGNNKFDLPYFFPQIGENGEVLVIGKDTVFHRPYNFVLKDQKGKPYVYDSLDGSIRVVSFFFSRCGTICPPANKNLSRVQDLFKNNPDLKILSLSVDPVYDTSDVLDEYSRSFQAVENKWFFLTGNKKEIYDIIIKGFKVPVADASEYDKNIIDIDETFIHTDKLLLIDREGFIRGIYGSNEALEIERLIVEIKVLINQKGS
jgi:protein SCO1/2